MGALADIFAAVHLNLETGSFEVDAAKVAGSVGQSMGDQLSSKLRSAALGAMGALGGAALSQAISGATKLNELAGDYQVQTGANAEEAKAFSGILNDLFKNAHQGYDEIAATLIGLKTHFDISGQAAATLGANVLDFAEVAGGTGADAVERLNSLVKTGVIAQADMAATMDKLTVAHQTWGININETLDALVKFAPAMNAFGMSTDQAIAWMSIFNKAGVDSQRVVMGFNTALQKVKTPEEFNALVAKIAATPDDLERAKLAVSLFGARAGGALANMLRPGTQSIADMAAVIGTDYTGAVQKAAAVNDNTFGGQALLMLHKFQGALADIGTNMGELLVAFALIGPRLTTALLAGIGGIGGLLVPKIIAPLLAAAGVNGAWMTTGTMIGTTIGAAMQAALLLAVPIAIFAFLTAARDEWTKQTRSWGINVPDLFTGQGALAPNPGIVPVGPQTVYPEGNAAAHQAAMEAAGKSTTEGLAAGVKAGTPDLQAMARNALSTVEDLLGSGFRNMKLPTDWLLQMFSGTTIASVKAAAARAGTDGMLALAKAITDNRQAPVDAFNTMLDMLKTPESSTQEAARLAGGLTSQALADGLRSNDPAIRAQAIAVKRMILERLSELTTAKGIGGAAMDALVEGLKSKDPEIRAAAQTEMDAVYAAMEDYARARLAGQSVGSAFLNGLGSVLPGIPGRPGTRSQSQFEGAASGMPYVARDMPVYVHQSEAILTVPQAAAWRAGSGGGQQITIEHVQIADAHDEFSLVQRLRFLASVQG